jgi:hypothetical protein
MRSASASGRHAFPAQFQVVVQATTDEVQVRVIQAGDDGASAQVDDLGGGLLQTHHVGGAADFNEFAAADGDGLGDGVLLVDGVELAVQQNQVRVTLAAVVMEAPGMG